MDLIIIILNYNTKSLLKSCLKSIYNKRWKHSVGVMVVDNCSTDGSVLMVRKDFPKVQLVESEKNLGFSGGNNLGLKKVNAKYALLLNSDTEVLSESLDNLTDFMDKNDFGVASCKLIDSEGVWQPNAGELPTLLPMLSWISGADDILRKFFPVSSYQARDENYYKDEDVGWVSGAAMCIRDDVIRKIGFLDENIFMYGEDVEYCLRAKKSGFKVGWTKNAQIVHLGGKSSAEPKYNQWKGEFKGLLYIYNKYYGFLAALFLRFVIYIFVLFRAAAFLFLGKPEFSKTYAKVIFSL